MRLALGICFQWVLVAPRCVNAPWPAATTGYEKDARSRVGGLGGRRRQSACPTKGGIAKSLILCAFDAELFEGGAMGWWRGVGGPGTAEIAPGLKRQKAGHLRVARLCSRGERPGAGRIVRKFSCRNPSR